MNFWINTFIRNYRTVEKCSNSYGRISNLEGVHNYSRLNIGLAAFGMRSENEGGIRDDKTILAATGLVACELAEASERLPYSQATGLAHFGRRV